MSAIQHLLERWGFVKLDRYGLVMTPDRRILSTRAAVLDDGAGGPIVGWQDRDLATAELKPWAPEPNVRNERTDLPARPDPSRRPEPARAVAPPAVTPVATPAPRPIERLVITEASILAQVPPAETAAVMAVDVAPEPAVDEDDWEWTIALAKARAAESQPQVIQPPPHSAAAGPATRDRASSPRTRQMPAPRLSLTAKDPAAGPKPELAGAIDFGEESKTSTRPAVAMPSAPAPATVIPVPALPTLQGTAQPVRLAPVVRTASEDPPSSPRRFAKGTGPVDPPAPVAQATLSDDTLPNLSIGDRTRPGIGLPEVTRVVQLPSIKRRMAARDGSRSV